MPNRVDIRTIKRQQKKKSDETFKDLKSALAAENKTIVRHLLEKFGKVEKLEEEDYDFEEPEEQTENEVKMEVEEETLEREETETKSDASEDEEEETEKRTEEKDENVHNRWTAGKSKPSEFDEDKAVIAEDFRIAFEERKRKQKETGTLNGWEECDIPDCFCKEELHGPGKQLF